MRLVEQDDLVGVHAKGNVGARGVTAERKAGAAVCRSKTGSVEHPVGDQCFGKWHRGCRLRGRPDRAKDLVMVGAKAAIGFADPRQRQPVFGQRVPERLRILARFGFVRHIARAQVGVDFRGRFGDHALCVYHGINLP